MNHLLITLLALLATVNGLNEELLNHPVLCLDLDYAQCVQNPQDSRHSYKFELYQSSTDTKTWVYKITQVKDRLMSHFELYVPPCISPFDVLATKSWQGGSVSLDQDPGNGPYSYKFEPPRSWTTGSVGYVTLRFPVQMGYDDLQLNVAPGGKSNPTQTVYIAGPGCDHLGCPIGTGGGGGQGSDTGHASYYY